MSSKGRYSSEFPLVLGEHYCYICVCCVCQRPHGDRRSGARQHPRNPPCSPSVARRSTHTSQMIQLLTHIGAEVEHHAHLSCCCCCYTVADTASAMRSAHASARAFWSSAAVNDGRACAPHCAEVGDVHLERTCMLATGNVWPVRIGVAEIGEDQLLRNQ